MLAAVACAASWYAAGAGLTLVAGAPKIRAVYAIRRSMRGSPQANPRYGFAYAVQGGRVYYVGERTTEATPADRAAEGSMLMQLGFPRKTAAQAASIDIPVALRRDDLLARLKALGYVTIPCATSAR